MNENNLNVWCWALSPLPYVLIHLHLSLLTKEDYARVRSLKEFLNNLKLLCGFNHQRIKH